MSHRSTPTSSAQPNGYASPSAYSYSHSHSHSSTPVPGTPSTPTAGGSGAKQGAQQAAKPKPTNVFSNDGSFLERFQRIQKDEEEKKKQDETLAKKRNFDDRFKKRGKRPPPDSSDSSKAPADPPAKKAKTETPMSQYEKEVKSYAGRSLKDDGIGVRPLVK